jgi:TusA-related sulfurtransferase
LVVDKAKRIVFCDLDGTLAEEHPPETYDKIGPPVPDMVAEIQKEIKNGGEVVVFSARADDPKSIKQIKEWLSENKLPAMRVTNIKEKVASEFWDNRARGVITNQGTFRDGPIDAGVRPKKASVPRETISKGK